MMSGETLAQRRGVVVGIEMGCARCRLHGRDGQRGGAKWILV